MNFVRSARGWPAYRFIMGVIASTLGWSSNRVEQIIVFVLLGICVNLIYAGLFLAVVWVAPNGRIEASTVSYLSACVFQYVANAKLTFGRKARDAGQVLRYGAAVLLGYVVSTVFLAWIAPPLKLPDLAALIIVALSLPVLNFITFSRWVYRSQGARAPKADWDAHPVVAPPNANATKLATLSDNQDHPL